MHVGKDALKFCSVTDTFAQRKAEADAYDMAETRSGGNESTAADLALLERSRAYGCPASQASRHFSAGYKAMCAFMMGIARNQPRGLATDPKREALFRKELLPPPMNNNTKNFGA